MKDTVFVEHLSSHIRMMDVLERVKRRPVGHDCIIVAQGNPGFGKTDTMTWLAVGSSAGEARRQRRFVDPAGERTGALFVTANADWTSNWMLSDFAQELGLHDGRDMSSRKLFSLVVSRLAMVQPLIIIDEADKIVKKEKVILLIKRITDATECVTILSGADGTAATIRVKYKDVGRRIFDVVNFGSPSIADVQKICDAVSDVKIDKSLCARMIERHGGQLDELMFSISFVETFAKKARLTAITAEQYGNRPLCREDVGRSNLLAVTHG